MPKHRLWAVATAGALVLAPRPAVSQVQFDNYCVMGSFQVCASVWVSTGMTGTQHTLTMRLWNLEGLMGAQHTITSIGLYHLGTGWGGTFSVTNAQYVNGSSSTNITTYWKKKANDIGTLGGIDIEVPAGTSGNNGVVGCTNPGGGTHWATCMSFPGSPYVELTFNLSEAFALDNLALRWHSQQLPDGSSLKCDTGGAGDYPDCGPPNVVPEPISIALLATGLAGVGGAALRRRRKTREAGLGNT